MSTPKLTRLVAKLDRETIVRNLEWVTEPPPADLTRGSDDVISQVHETTYGGVKLRVFQKRTLNPGPEFETSYWTTDFVLQFIDDNGAVEWETENVTGLDDLIETIRFKTNKIAKKIDAILAA